MTPEQFFAEALTHVQSRSIRDWAASEHNRPLWLRIAADVLAKDPKSDPLTFATYITLTAMG